MMNLQLARIYLQAAQPDHLARTWGDVFGKFIESLKRKPVQKDWERLRDSPPFASLRSTELFYTEPIHFQRVMRHATATASTQRALRRLRNYAMDLGWLLRPVLSKRAWPKIQPKPRRAITSEEHRRVVDAEADAERKSYYQMLWFTGGAQTDVAHFHSDHVDKATLTICFQRRKMRWRNKGFCRIPIGEEIQAFLDHLPKEGWFFPSIRGENASERASKFKRLCLKLGINDVTLHSYRYALAERAFWSGMPEVEAMAYLGHNRRARHHAYAKNAPRVALPLCFYEKRKVRALSSAAAENLTDCSEI